MVALCVFPFLPLAKRHYSIADTIKANVTLYFIDKNNVHVMPDFLAIYAMLKMYGPVAFTG